MLMMQPVRETLSATTEKWPPLDLLHHLTYIRTADTCWHAPNANDAAGAEGP
ncbi:hypothetical protein J6590_052152 [Homalodisca vitripennis]|nr:hypothetical protein J6590_052152 [Homalodisca vitripennis]